MTDLARAGKWVGLGERGLGIVDFELPIGESAARRPSLLRREARASMPKPPPALRRKERREGKCDMASLVGSARRNVAYCIAGRCSAQRNLRRRAVIRRRRIRLGL